MTQNDTHDTATESEDSGMQFNTIAGWVLFSGVLALGVSILAGKYFHAGKPERPDPAVLVYEGVGGGSEAAVEMTMAEALTLVTAADGEKVFAKCAACHTSEAGGANGVGPNLNGIMGSGVGQVAGFGYSSAMSAHGGTWDWEQMNLWLANPRRHIDGTSMAFAGLSKIEDRAAVALYLNGEGGLPLPEFVPAEEGAAEGEAAEGTEGDVAEREAEAEADATADAEAEQNAAEATSTQTAEAES